MSGFTQLITAEMGDVGGSTTTKKRLNTNITEAG